MLIMDQAKKYFIYFLVLCAAVFIAWMVISSEIARQRFIDMSYSGIVKEKVYKSNQRDMPDVLIDSTWYSFGILEDDVNSAIEVGDSLTKKRGYSKIIIYRKDSLGLWSEVNL